MARVPDASTTAALLYRRPPAPRSQKPPTITSWCWAASACHWRRVTLSSAGAASAPALAEARRASSPNT